MILEVLNRKRRELVKLETDPNGGFSDFLLFQWKKFQPHLNHYQEIAKQHYYGLAKKSLHILRLWALKLESFSTKSLHKVKNVAQENEQKKPAEPESGQNQIEIKDSSVYFSALKEKTEEKTGAKITK